MCIDYGGKCLLVYSFKIFVNRILINSLNIWRYNNSTVPNSTRLLSINSFINVLCSHSQLSSLMIIICFLLLQKHFSTAFQLLKQLYIISFRQYNPQILANENQESKWKTFIKTNEKSFMSAYMKEKKLFRK